MTRDCKVSGNPLIRGSLDEIRGDTLRGWIFSAIPGARPLLLVDGEPARLLDSSYPRPDVCAAFGVNDAENPGFIFRLPPARAGATLQLYGVTHNGVYLVTESVLKHPVAENNLLAQIGRAASVASQKNAIGIVCWDGAHNAIGRAKALYDIAATQRPVALICYLHPEFGGKLWTPLRNWDGNIITIPWKRRDWGHALLARYGINFGTVWICKPRLPSFMLAAKVSREDTRFVLDIDDEEEAFFSAQNLVPTCYDMPGANLARFLMERIPARTVSGPMPRNKYGGLVVRHARKPLAVKPKKQDEIRNIIFCGTIRPHKNVAAIARALNMLSAGENMNLHFHVYGDIQPPEYQKDLEDAGAIIHGMTSLEALPDVLETADVIISGFLPEADETGKLIARYQVPAKISDALAAGKPVLVPKSEAVADLADIPGIYLFDESSFLGQLLAALRQERPIYMPADFMPEGAWQSFAEAEEQAKPCGIIRGMFGGNQAANKKTVPSLVLVWKQHDAGLYGRRIDQIARSCKVQFPEHKVIILEFVRGEENGRWDDEAETSAPGADMSMGDVYCDERYALEDLLERKKLGLEKDGINYRTIAWNKPHDLRRKMSMFLDMENLLPENALFVIFPIIEPLEELAEQLRPYRKIVDVVDNELGWAKDNARRARMLEQYFWVMQKAEKVVFNSPVTRNFFVERNFVAESDARVIPNWYDLPDGFAVKRTPLPGTEKHIFYSGNMNDRIDWDLLRLIVALPDVKLHLAGTADRQKDELQSIITAGAIYHGVLKENETLELLRYMDAAIVPHKYDEISKYMNPIKLGMYQAAGLKVICPEWIECSENGLDKYSSKENAIDMIRRMPKAVDDYLIEYHDMSDAKESMSRLYGIGI